MEILFVYNAEKDIVSGIVDYAHKVFMPSTYKCDLCALTHHNLGERKSWKAFKKKIDFKISFHYIKEFEKEFNQSYDYPVVIMRSNQENKVVLNNLEISKIDTIDDLIIQIDLIINELK